MPSKIFNANHARRLTTTWAVLLLLSCSTTEKPIGPVNGGPEVPVEWITLAGENFAPHLTKNNEIYIYISKNRLAHKQAQIYLLNSNTKKERRLTYQDGDIYEVNLTDNDQKIIYSSSTDEEKEVLPLVQENLQTPTANLAVDFFIKGGDISFLPKTELYVSSFDGHDINRITHHPGYDGQPVTSLNGKSIYYTTHDAPTKKIQISVIKNNRVAQRISDPNFHEESPRLSPDEKQLLWVRHNGDGKSSKIMLGDVMAKNAHPLLEPQNLKKPTTAAITSTGTATAVSTDTATVAPTETTTATAASTSTAPAASTDKPSPSPSPSPEAAQNVSTPALMFSENMNLDPAWAPDGELLVWSSKHPSETIFRLTLARKDGTCIQQINLGEVSARHPFVSSDGKWIIFSGTKENSQQVGRIPLAPKPCKTEINKSATP